MANQTLPGGATPDTSTGYFFGWRGCYNQLTLPAGANSTANGDRPILITRARTYVNGRAGYPTVTLRIGFGGESSRQLSGTFTRTAATTASLTPYQTINAYFANSDGTLSRRFWIQNTFSDEFIRIAKQPGGNIWGYSFTGDFETGTAITQGTGPAGSLCGDYDWFSAPAAPTSISASSGSTAGSVSVSWGASSATGSVATINGYTIQLSTSSNFSSPINRTAAGNVTTLDVTGLTAGTAYYVRVAARNIVTDAGNTTSQWRTLPGTVTAGLGAPSNPSNLSVSLITQTSMRLSWTASTNATGYEVFLDGVSDGETTNNFYNFSNLSAQTEYTLGVRAFNDSGATTTYSSTVTTTAETLGGNPTYAADAAYPNAKIGLQYSAQVTATNGVSYALAYGDLPPGLSLSTNGTISGRPEQRPNGFYANETAGTLDSFTFGIRATGPTGSTPTTKQFTISTTFPGERITGSSTRRDFIIARRWDGEQWVPIQRVRRATGSSTWIDITTT